MSKLEEIARKHSDIYAGNDLDLPAPYHNILAALREVVEECAKVCEEVDSSHRNTRGIGEHAAAIRDTLDKWPRDKAAQKAKAELGGQA